jgi:predicted transcriptional regulator
MTRAERELLKANIILYYINTANGHKRQTVKHFKEKNVKERTIYSIISTFLKTKTFKDKPRRGRPPKLDDQSVSRLLSECNNFKRKEISKNYNICQSSVFNYLKRKSDDSKVATINVEDSLQTSSRKSDNFLFSKNELDILTSEILKTFHTNKVTTGNREVSKES